ncbi:hypothetical protein Taro_038781 [Colocasia esculenta]|uniref:Uncharacterized protein n=1 Tax=Colocasia esculenta TaxID=4460 RepID=A0A843W7M1_COLES|nr:hypothetical protein [Colocasia esculenta]
MNAPYRAVAFLRRHRPMSRPQLSGLNVYGLYSCMVSLARLRPDRGRRTQIKFINGLTGLNEAFHYIRVDEPVASTLSDRRIEDIAPEHIELVGQLAEGEVPASVPDTPVVQETLVSPVEEEVAHTEGEHVEIPIEESFSAPVEEPPVEEEHEEVVPDGVPQGQSKEVHMEDAPAQGEPNAGVFEDPFQEGLVEDASDDDEDDDHAHLQIVFAAMHDEPTIGAGGPLGPSVSVPEAPAGPPGPSQQSDQVAQSVPEEPVAGPSGPSIPTKDFVGSSEPSEQEEAMVGPSRLFEKAREVVVPSGLSVHLGDFGSSEPSSSVDPPLVLDTPAPSSPSAPFTAPHALEPSKKSLPKHNQKGFSLLTGVRYLSSIIVTHRLAKDLTSSTCP